MSTMFMARVAYGHVHPCGVELQVEDA